MKFSNAYSLFRTLFERSLLTGFRIEPIETFYGVMMELAVETKIEQARFVKLVKEIFEDWRRETEKAIYPSNYDCRLYLNDKGDLCFSVDAIHDLQEYHCDENLIESILQIIIVELDLGKIVEQDEGFEYQFEITLKLEVVDFGLDKFDFTLFSINSCNDDPKVAKKINDLINLHIKSIGLENLQKSIVGYFKNLHDGNSDYHGICIVIENNDIDTFHGVGADVDENLKDFLINYPLKFALDLEKIEKNLKL